MVKRSTRQDVARAAGVSGATVSRVYNSPELVGRETVDRVKAAAAALGFVPDKHAAALRRGTSGTLLFVEIEAEGGQGYRWPSQRAYQSLYGEIVRAVLHASQRSAFTLQLVSLPAVDQVAQLVRQGDFAGILGFDVTDQAVADALAGLGRPVVCCHHGDHLTGVSTVATDNRAGGRLQARSLAGRHGVAYVTGLRDEVRSHRLRWEGFAEACPGARVLDGAVGYSQGHRIGRLSAAEVRSGALTAFACVNDLTALGLVQGLAAEGLSVPRDATVVGYDNLVLTGLVGTGLPTVEARLPLVYTRAFEVLGTLVNGGEVHEVVEPQLVTAE